MAVITSLTGARSWTIAADWEGGVLPADNVDSVVIAAGCQMLMNQDQSAYTGLLGVTISGDATTPGMLYWKNGTTGHLKIKTGYNLIGTSGAAKGRLLANSDGVWGNTGALAFADKAVIDLGATSKVDARYLDIALYGYNSITHKYLRTYGVRHVVTGSAAADTLTKAAHGLTNGTPVMIMSSVDIPAPLAIDTVYYVVGATTDTFQLAAVSGGAAIDLTSDGTGTIEVYTGAASGANPVNVFEDVTAETGWVTTAGQNAVIMVNSTAPASCDQQRLTMSIIAASAVTLSAALDSAQYPGARLFLMSRNVSIRSACISEINIVDYSNASTSGGVFQCEIRSTAGTGTTFYGSGVYYGTGHMVSGTISGCRDGVLFGTGHTVSGTISGCMYGVHSGTGHTVSGTISGCTCGVYYGTKYTVNGTISGCTYGVHSGTGHTVGGTISGCTNGVYYGTEHTVSGIISGCHNGVYSGTGHIISGTISGCMYGINSGTEYTVSGTISGCYNGIYSGTGHMVSGTISGCYNGVYYGTEHTVSGTISGCYNGVYYGTGYTISGTISGCTNGIYYGTGHTVSGTISGCTYGIYYGTGHTVSKAISECTYGIYYGTGHTVSGTISGCTNGIHSGTGHTISGTISGCTNGVYYGTGHIISGTISECTYGVYSGTGHTVSGTISGCTNGIYSGTGHMISGTISGCTYGVYSGTGHMISGTISGCNNVFRFGTLDTDVLSIILRGASIPAAPTFFNRNTAGVGSQGKQGVFSENHGKILGASYAYLPTGDVIRNTTTVRAGGAASSLEVVPLSNCAVSAPIQIFEWTELSVPASEQSRTIYLRADAAWSVYPTADELYIEAEYISDGTTFATTIIRSTAVLSDGSTWVSFAIPAFTPAVVGHVRYRGYLKKYEASRKIYIDNMLVSV